MQRSAMLLLSKSTLSLADVVRTNKLIPTDREQDLVHICHYPAPPNRINNSAGPKAGLSHNVALSVEVTIILYLFRAFFNIVSVQPR